MMRSILLSAMTAMLWTNTTMALSKCAEPMRNGYKDTVNLVSTTLNENGTEKWWKGEPQIDYDFKIVNNNSYFAVQIRASGGAFSLANGTILNASACRLISIPGLPPGVLISIDTTSYTGKPTILKLSKTKSDIHVDWDGTVALLKPAGD